MKLIKNIATALLAGLAAASCNDFIDVPPTGVIDGDLAYTQPEEMVTAAYAALGDCWYTYPFNLMTTDNSRTPNTYGYYTSLKEVPQRSKGETFNGSWQAFAMNDYVFRYADVMLMRAEALVELDRLPEALAIVNDIRTRAKNSVDKHIGYAADRCEISTYPTGYFTSKEIGRKCVQWERRLEMAMENDRYFSLRRWGIASETLNAYFATEKNVSYEKQKYVEYMNEAHFTPGKNEFWPVPYNQLYYVPNLYTQNKNYND